MSDFTKFEAYWASPEGKAYAAEIEAKTRPAICYELGRGNGPGFSFGLRAKDESGLQLKIGSAPQLDAMISTLMFAREKAWGPGFVRKEIDPHWMEWLKPEENDPAKHPNDAVAQ